MRFLSLTHIIFASFVSEVLVLLEGRVSIDSPVLVLPVDSYEDKQIIVLFCPVIILLDFVVQDVPPFVASKTGVFPKVQISV